MDKTLCIYIVWWHWPCMENAYVEHYSRHRCIINPFRCRKILVRSKPFVEAFQHTMFFIAIWKSSHRLYQCPIVGYYVATMLKTSFVSNSQILPIDTCQNEMFYTFSHTFFSISRQCWIAPIDFCFRHFHSAFRLSFTRCGWCTIFFTFSRVLHAVVHVNTISIRNALARRESIEYGHCFQLTQF